MRKHPGFTFVKLSLEIGLFSHGLVALHNDLHLGTLSHGSLFLNGSFLGGGSFNRSVFSHEIFFDDLALSVAAGAGCQQILGPGNDLITVGGDNIHNTGNGSQSSQDLQCDFHIQDLRII